MSGLMRSSLIACVTAPLLLGCDAQSGEDYAKRVFPELVFDEVLAYKSRGRPSYNCTYLVLRLPQRSLPAPPRVQLPDLAVYDDLIRAGLWHKTADPRSLELSARHQCLVGNPAKIDGAGVAGFSVALTEILQQPDAWFASYGGVEGQHLLIYAPEQRLAAVLRFGD